MTPGKKRTTARTIAVAAAGLLALSLTTVLGGTASAQQDTAAAVPGENEISSSRNIRQIANIPKQAPFNTEAALGTDIAFTGKYAVVGNYDGFIIYDISRPEKPKIVSQVLCPGSQNDVSVSGDLLFLSTDSSRSDNSCNSTPKPATEKDAWEGIKVFDIKDKANPRYVSAVETKCGSHTNTLVPDKRRQNVYIYVSSYSPNATFPDCQPPHDLISIVKVPVKNPAAATLVAEPVLFPDGGNTGIPGSFPANYVTATSGCHDITAYPEKDLAAGACMGEGVLFDISDREKPRVINTVKDDKNFAFWHSATFNNDGTKVVFTDELGGGGAPACTAAIGSVRGANGVYDITGRGDKRKLEFRSYYKIPRVQAETENCVAHNGSLIPVFGRDIMVQAWYQGGVSVWDFTNSSRPVEIAYWERGPYNASKLVTGGSWSAYYYNGHIYSSDIQKGLDVLELNDWRTFSAQFVRMREFNPQSQGRYLG
ncbi:LVIVD repeat-containing protein [Allokutzneria oryzae]|uniref:LVIVD repeat-containing protein n=1 Tax=Allokutzneria oryzae TaxID=1378989 RepID=A0ABV6A5A7_9PSEU